MNTKIAIKTKKILSKATMKVLELEMQIQYYHCIIIFLIVFKEAIKFLVLISHKNYSTMDIDIISVMKLQNLEDAYLLQVVYLSILNQEVN